MDANDGPLEHAGYEFISSSGTFNDYLAYRVACIPISAFDAVDDAVDGQGRHGQHSMRA